MKKKGPRDIPDFSRKKKGPPTTEQPQSQTPPPARQDRNMRPQGAAAKSGRRGQSR